MKLPYKDDPTRCGFTERELNMRVGELRKYVPDATEAPKPAYLFTWQQFLEQVHVPLYSIDLDKGLQDFKLQKHINRIHAILSLKSKEFTKGIPHLPGCQDMACIELITRERGAVSLCFSLSNLYCSGVYLQKTKVFYENSDRECRTNPTTTGFLVEGSFPLGFLGHTYSSLGIQLPLELTSQKFVDSYISWTKLGTVDQNLGRALYGLGMFALLFMEPIRQLVVKTFLQPDKSEDKDNYSADKYGTLSEDLMKAIRDWGKDCLTARGLKEETDHVLREDPAVDYGKRAAALANIKMINYAGILYYF